MLSPGDTSSVIGTQSLPANGPDVIAPSTDTTCLCDTSRNSKPDPTPTLRTAADSLWFCSEHEGDGPSSQSRDHRTAPPPSRHEGGRQHPGGVHISGPVSGVGTSTSASSGDAPSTPNILQPMGSSAGDVVMSGVSPHTIGGGYGGNRPSSSRQPQDPFDNGEFVLSTSTSTSTNPVPSGVPPAAALGHPGYEHHQPRGHMNLWVVTQGLSDPSVHIQDGAIPDLISTTDVSISSPWASSTDSTYSTTPSEARAHPQAAWVPSSGSPRHSWLSPYPAASEPLTTTPYLFPPSPHPLVSSHHGYPGHPVAQNHYGIIDAAMGGAFSAAEDLSQGLHHPVMGADSGSSAAVTHGSVGPRGSVSLSSVGSPSPVTASASQAGPLITPTTSLPADRIGVPGMGRHKELIITDASGMGMPVSMGGGVALLGSGTYDMGGGDNSPGGGGFLPSQGLGGMGGCVSGPLLASSPLAKGVRNMIPIYLDTYWSHHGTAYPLAHRRMCEESGDNVLRCAMAAVGSQLLDSKEDRNKGIVLHDHVVQELKLVSPSAGGKSSGGGALAPSLLPQKATTNY